jgi:hypothetical protein
MGFLRGFRGWVGRLGRSGRAEEQQGPPFHYFFAHYALRRAAFLSPLELLKRLDENGGREMIETLWVVTAEMCGQGSQPDFGIEDIKVHTIRLQDSRCAVVEMPEPRSMTQCYFVAVLVGLDERTDNGGDPSPSVRYVTLEKGFEMSAESRTVLCEWTSEGTHLNYGDGPAPNLEAFVEELSKESITRGPGEAPE